MRRTYLIPLFALLAAPLAAQADPDKAVDGGGNLPSGWSARTDRGQPLSNVKFVTMGSGFHVTLGPATVLYRGADAASGNYHAVANITQTKAPDHAEAYGLFVAGKDLAGEGQSYVYFLVRGDGVFLIKRRDGARAVNITTGWTKHEAVKAADAAGKATNKLEITVKDGQAMFAVNGTTVHTMDATDFDGVAGLRVNHNLDVHVDGFGLHKM